MSIFGMGKKRRESIGRLMAVGTGYGKYVDALRVQALLSAGDIKWSDLKKSAVKALIVELERTALELRELIGEA